MSNVIEVNKKLEQIKLVSELPLGLNKEQRFKFLDNLADGLSIEESYNKAKDVEKKNSDIKGVTIRSTNESWDLNTDVVSGVEDLLDKGWNTNKDALLSESTQEKSNNKIVIDLGNTVHGEYITSNTLELEFQLSEYEELSRFVDLSFLKEGVSNWDDIIGDKKLVFNTYFKSKLVGEKEVEIKSTQEKLNKLQNDLWVLNKVYSDKVKEVEGYNELVSEINKLLSFLDELNKN